MNKIIIINGPNLNLLGKREPDIYGSQSFERYFKSLQEDFSDLELDYFQSNIEGEIVNFIQESSKKNSGIIINAGGYTHTSVAILDALLAVKKPTIELHITNIYKREDFRHKSLISKAADGIICGLGADGYVMALDGIKKIINNEN